MSTGDPSGTLSIWPAASMNAAGNSVVVWIDSRAGPHGEIYGQRFDANGQAVGSNFQISAGAGVIYDRPEVALLDDGRFMVVWTDSSSVGFRARGRQFQGDGSPVGPPFLLKGEDGSGSGLPDLVSDGTRYHYTWVGTHNGSPAVFVSQTTEPVAVEADEAVQPLALESYPNPFAAATTLQYALPEAGPVTLVVYDLLGREVARLVDRPQGQGRHSVGFGGTGLPPGLYVARLRQGTHIQSRLLIRTD